MAKAKAKKRARKPKTPSIMPPNVAAALAGRFIYEVSRQANSPVEIIAVAALALRTAVMLAGGGGPSASAAAAMELDPVLIFEVVEEMGELALADLEKLKT